MTYAIETENLSKKFIQTKSLSKLISQPFRKGKEILAVNNISLQVEKGILFALVGLNGAGKTTLIKILCSLILPSRGIAYVNGYNILTNAERAKASIGLVTGEERSFYWRLTGRQNLDFFAVLYNLSKKQAKVRVEELLDLLEIEEPDKRFQEYSTGMKQRLAIARSLLNDPQVLFMDEPTKSLDPVSAQGLRAFIKEKLVRRQQKTLFFTTHNLNEAEVLSDRLAIMDKGKIGAQGTLEELKESMGKPEATMEEIFNHYTRVAEERGNIQDVSS